MTATRTRSGVCRAGACGPVGASRLRTGPPVRGSGRRRTWVGVLIGWGCALLLASAAEAGFIAMETTLDAELRDGEVVLRVTARNRGDEAAWNVRLEALFPLAPRSSEIFEKLDVNEAAEHTFRWPAPRGEYRQLVIPVISHYTDANYYPFSAVSQSVLSLGEPPVAVFTARIDPVELDPKGLLRVGLRSLDGRPHSVEVRVVAPAELIVEPASARVEVPAGGEVLADFAMENFSGLADSVYGIWAVVAEETTEGIVERVFAGSIRLLEPAPDPVFRLVVATCLVVAAIVLVVWQLGAVRRFRSR